MTNLKRWSAVTAAGATVCLAGVICVGAGLAGAQSNDAMKRSVPEASPGATPLKPGTYNWFIDGLDRGTITFASNNTYTSTFQGDSGTWVQAGKTSGLSITGGNDAGGVCVFAGHVSNTGKAISSPPSRATGPAQVFTRAEASTSPRCTRRRRAHRCLGACGRPARYRWAHRSGYLHLDRRPAASTAP